MACCIKCKNYDTDLYHWKKSRCKSNVNNGEGCTRVFDRADSKKVVPDNCHNYTRDCTCQHFILEMNKYQYQSYIISEVEI